MIRTTALIIGLATILPANEAKCFVDITGNSAFTDKQIARLVDLNLPDDSLSSRIENLYQEQGYFGTEVRSVRIDRRGGKIIEISEGGQAKIADIRINLISESAEIELDNFKRNIIGQPASRLVLDRFAIQIIESLADSGRPFAQGQWREFEFDNAGNILAEFRLVAGPMTRVSGFEFRGIKRTRPKTVIRTMDIGIGEMFDQGRIKRSEKEIAGLPYIEIVSPFDLRISSEGDSCEIIYYLKELPSTSFDGVGGLVSSGKKNDFLGRLSLEFGDILGSGRSFRLFWNKKDPNSGELKLDYLEPFLLGSRFDLSLTAFQKDRDTLYLETGVGFGFAYKFRSGLYGHINFSFKRIEPEGESAVASSSGKSVSTDFILDQTDFDQNPRSGYVIETGVDYRYRDNRVIRPGTDPPANITSASVSGDYYLPVKYNLVFKIGLKSWGVVSSDRSVPVDELRYIGGYELLRGYPDERFPAYRYAILTIEPRLITGRYSRAYLFGDFGAVKSSNTADRSWLYHPGYGFGLVSPTALGLFKVEIGWGERGFPSDGVLNFGLAGKF